jgi:hypothetical protein
VSELTSKQAGALMSAWMADVRVSRLDDETQAALGDGRVHFVQRVRVMLAERNKLASDAMWDDDLLKARELLMKHGLLDKRPSLSKSVYDAEAYSRKRAARDRLQRDVERVYATQMRGTHWGTVK